MPAKTEPKTEAQKDAAYYATLAERARTEAAAILRQAKRYEAKAETLLATERAGCPACSEPDYIETDIVGSKARECLGCGGIYGAVIGGTRFRSSMFPGGKMGHHPGCSEKSGNFYFDVTLEDPDGKSRCHGWACRECGGIVQVG